ncbi:flavin reductase family protein [Streptomyces sp. NPDC056883]|uniref:flavin reductase family protein n=1 Tax=Streptomyces sp. NPDC056883 TaxID=3345959 RepID=UPI0036A0064B
MNHDLRDVMRSFATGVCVVSTYTDNDGVRTHNAITINSLTSVSLEPPLVSLSFRHDSEFFSELLRTGVVGISILGAEGESTARAFARRRPERDQALTEVPGAPGEATGTLLFEAAAWMECSLRDHVVAGDHVMVIGEVVAMGARETQTPLIFLQGGFHRFELEQV